MRYLRYPNVQIKNYDLDVKNLRLKRMLFCEDCRQRAMLESAISKQKKCESANDFYERLINHWHIKERFLFGLTPNNLEKILKTDIEMPLHEMIKLLTEDEATK